MKLQYHTASLLTALLVTTASAQVLTNGNSQLPSCGASCPLLQQAAQACGGTTTADQGIWSCFCQSGYLKTLYSSPSGICDSVCTSASDNQQIMTWYTTNCGTDDGASEHANSGSAPSSSTAAAAVATSSAALPSTTASGGTVASSSDTTAGQHWWQTHTKWVIMLIVLFVGLLLLALIAVWLKRRHDRKADQIREGFNAGITSRSTPMTTVSKARGDVDMSRAGDASDSQIAAAGGLGSGSGRNSPARTREAFMPYGYGYARSESRLASRTDVNGKSPMARGGTPVDELEKGEGMQAETAGGTRSKKQRRTLVRERSVEGPESPEIEKSLR